MAIRIRKINGQTVALCAAKTKPKEGDIYLDDAIHHALSVKFSRDFYTMGFTDVVFAYEDEYKLIERIESDGNIL